MAATYLRALLVGRLAPFLKFFTQLHPWFVGFVRVRAYFLLFHFSCVLFFSLSMHLSVGCSRVYAVLAVSSTSRIQHEGMALHCLILVDVRTYSNVVL